MSLRRQLVAQFAKPRGALGHIAGFIMASRSSNRARNAWTVDLLELEPGYSVLEVGCGPGLALEMVVERTEGVVTGIDHSRAMIAQARSRNRSAIATGRLRLIEGSLCDLPRDEVYDRIFLINVIQFLADTPASIQMFHGRLAPGGRLVVTYMPRHQAATAADADAMAGTLAEAMDAAGFGDIRRDVLPLRPVPAVAVTGTRRHSRRGGMLGQGAGTALKHERL